MLGNPELSLASAGVGARDRKTVPLNLLRPVSCCPLRGQGMIWRGELRESEELSASLADGGSAAPSPKLRFR